VAAVSNLAELTGAERIAAERARQMAEEGYTSEHDDANGGDDIAMAAACYAAPEPIFVRRDFAAGTVYRDPWPWNERLDKRPYNGNVLILETTTMAQRIRLLEKAGALIAAEIDRLLRADGKPRKARTR
jgi:hypothetical protein